MHATADTDEEMKRQFEKIVGIPVKYEMLSVNPMFIPRNHRIEAVIRDAEAGRFEKFHELVEVLAHPFDDQPKFADYAKPPQPEEEVRQTFCGT